MQEPQLPKVQNYEGPKKTKSKNSKIQKANKNKPLEYVFRLDHELKKQISNLWVVGSLDLWFFGMSWGRPSLCPGRLTPAAGAV